MSVTDDLGPRVAVDVKGRKRFGFLASEPSEGIATVVFLGPRGRVTREISEDRILGIVGKTFWSSGPVSPQVPRFTGIPEVCDRVVFFDNDRQRKGWVWEIEGDGTITLLVESIVRLPEGKADHEVSSEEIAVEHVFERRWPEEIVLLPPGEGYRELTWKEIRDAEFFMFNGLNMPVERRAHQETKGGQLEGARKAQTKNDANRGAEMVRELVAKMATIKKA